MELVNASGLSLAMHATSASPHAVTLVAATLVAGFAGEKSERLIGDWAYDSDPLDTILGGRGIKIIATPEEQEEAEDLGRSQAQVLQEALEDRAAVRPAGELQAAGGVLRAAGGELPRLRTVEVHRHLAEVL